MFCKNLPCLIRYYLTTSILSLFSVSSILPHYLLMNLPSVLLTWLVTNPFSCSRGLSRNNSRRHPDLQITPSQEVSGPSQSPLLPFWITPQHPGWCGNGWTRLNVATCQGTGRICQIRQKWVKKKRSRNIHGLNIVLWQ